MALLARLTAVLLAARAVKTEEFLTLLPLLPSLVPLLC